MRGCCGLVPTPLGDLGVAWGKDTLLAVQLPEPTPERTLSRLLDRVPGAEPRPLDEAPAWVQKVARRLSEHLAGRVQDLRDVPLRLDGVPPFHRRVYEVVRALPVGRTATYGEIAARVGRPGAARAVGQAMAKNPFPLVVPCHRVLAASGLGGYSAHRGLDVKRTLLALEGAGRDGTARSNAAAATAANSRGHAPESLFRGESGLEYDPEAAVAALRAADPVLRRLIDRVGPLVLRVQGVHSAFSALAEAIIYQQLAPRAASTIAGRVREVCGGTLTPEAVLAAGEPALRGAGLSRAKLLALYDLAEKTRAGRVPSLEAMWSMSDEQLIERLTEVRGIGRWTVEMLLIFRLGRPDVLSTGDYGLRRAFALTFRRGRQSDGAVATPEEMLRRGERWRPYRSAACWYLWRALELPKR